MTLQEQLRKILLKCGVDYVQELGFEEVNEQNILTDYSYGKLFRSLLEYLPNTNEDYNVAIQSLLKEIEA